MQLYRCDWLNELQKSNVLLALNAMIEKSSFMNVTDLPLIRTIETLPNELSLSQKNLQASTLRKVSGGSNLMLDPLSMISDDANSLMQIKRLFMDNKHDTRIVNEAFQVTFKP